LALQFLSSDEKTVRLESNVCGVVCFGWADPLVFSMLAFEAFRNLMGSVLSIAYPN
jgi:hypothetical protein